MNDLPDELLKRLDRYAAMQGMTQKQAIEHLLRGALNLAIPDLSKPKTDKPTASQKEAAPSSTANLFARRNGSKLNQLVQQRHNPDAWAEDGGTETDVDLLNHQIKSNRCHQIKHDQHKCTAQCASLPNVHR